MADIRLHYNPSLYRRTLQTQSVTYRNLVNPNTDSQASVQDLRNDVFKKYENALDFLNYQKMQDVMATDVAKTVAGLSDTKPRSPFDINPNVEKFYGEFYSKALSYLTGKRSSGQDLMLRTEELARELTYSFNEKVNSYRAFSEVRDSYEYFKSANNIIVFDLETFGGRDQYGVQGFDKITEFTFNVYDRTQPGDPIRRTTGFVGFHSDAEADFYEKQFRDFTDIGSLTERQRVIAESLAKIGHRDTVITEDKNAPGRFIIERYVNNTEDIITKENIMRGIREARRIGAIQATHVDDLGMMRWERDFADALLEMQRSDASIVGYNAVRADIQWLRQYYSQHASPAMRSYLNSQGFDPSFSLPSQRIFDPLSIIQHAQGTGRALDLIYPEGSARQLREQGLSPFQQEALINRFFPNFYESIQRGAHTSSADVEALYRLVTEAEVGGRPLFDRLISLANEANESSISANLRGNRSQLFLATESLGGPYGNQAIFGFKDNTFTGSLKTMDGYELAEALTPRRGFAEYLTKKDVTYTIDEIQKLTPNEDFIEKMKTINPALAVDELVMVKLSPVTTSLGEDNPYSDLIQKNNNASYLIGTETEIRRELSKSMILYAESDENGNFRVVEDARNKITKHKLVNEDGKVVLKSEKLTDSELIQQTIRDGTIVNINDSASRMLRDNKFKQYNALSNFIDEINKSVEADTSNLPFEQKKRIAVEKMLEASRRVAHATSTGAPLSGEMMNESVAFLQDILGYKDSVTGAQRVHPGTVDNALAALQHFESIKPEVDAIINEINLRAPNATQAQKDFLFKRGIEALQVEALNRLDQRQFDLTDGYVRGYNRDYFEVDMSRFLRRGRGTPIPRAIENVNPEGILRINLNAGGEYRLINALMGNLDHPAESVNFSEEAMKRLTQFVDFMQEEHGLLKNIYGDSAKATTKTEAIRLKEEFLANNTPDTFAKKILLELREVRKHDPTAGYITINRIHNVMGPSQFSGVLAPEEIKTILNETFERFSPESFMEISRSATGRYQQASGIVDDIFMTVFDRDQLRGFGYNDRQVEKLAQAREVRRRDYVRLVDQILQGVQHTDMLIHYDAKAGTFGLINEGRYIDLTKVLPRDQFSDGMFYTQIGRSRFATELHLGIENLRPGGALLSENITLKSGIGLAIDNAWDLGKNVESTIRRGNDPEDAIMQWIGRIARDIREGSAVTMMDEQDIKSQFELNIKGVVNALPHMGELNQLDLTHKDELIKRFTREGFSWDSMSDAERQLWALNQEDILKFVGSRTSDPFINELIMDINPRAKHSRQSEGWVRADAFATNLEFFNRGVRGIDNQSRYLAFREDYARERLEELNLSDRIDLGAPLRTEVGYRLTTRVYEGTSQTTQTEFVASRMALTSREYVRRLSEEKEALRAVGDLDKALALESALMRGNLTEGGAIGNARIADALFQNYDRQKISFARKLFADHEENIDQIKDLDRIRSIVPEIKITDDGKISFTYKKGVYVDRFDRLFDEIVEFGDKVTPVGAKYEGALRFGFFTKGGDLLVDESDVIQNVTRFADERGLRIGNRQEFLRIADQLYDAAFYVERLTTEPYRKVMENRLEKHMTAFAYYGLGASAKVLGDEVVGDHRILRALEGMGLEQLQGKVLSYEFFQELLDEKNIHRSILSDMSTRGKLTEREYVRAIEKAGFGNVEEFRQALIRERYLPSDELSRVLGADFVLLNEDVGHKNITSPIVAGVNEMINAERARLKGTIDDEGELVRRANENVIRELNGAFIKGGQNALRLDSEGRIVIPEFDFYGTDYIDTDRFAQAYNRVTGKEFDQIAEPGQITRNVYSLMQDYTGTSSMGFIDPYDNSPEGRIRRELSRGAKITERERNMLNLTRYSQSMIDRLAQEMDPQEFERVFGPVVERTEAGYRLRDEYANRSLMGYFIDEVDRNMFADPTDRLVTAETLTPEQRYLESTVRALSDVSGGPVGIRTAERAHSSAMNILAMKHNEGLLTLDEISHYGFDPSRAIKLSDLDIGSGGDADYLLNESLNSIYRGNVVFDKHGNIVQRGNLVIDLQDDVITADLLKDTKLQSRYLAIGAIPTDRVGEEVLKRHPQQTLSRIVKLRNELADPRNLTEAEVRYKRGEIVNLINQVNEDISAMVYGNQGFIRGLSEAVLDRTVLGKASLMHLDDILALGDTIMNALDNMRFDGKSLLEHHRAGTMIDFKLHSVDHFEAMGFFDKKYLDDMGLSPEEMKQILRTEGVAGFSHRHPTIYKGAIRPVQMYLYDDLSGNQAIEFSAGALRAKTDADGDMPRSWVAQFTNAQGDRFDSIQASKLGADPRVLQSFAGHQRAMYYNALVENRAFNRRINEAIEDVQKTEESIARTMISDRTLNTGRLYPELSSMPTDAQRAAYQAELEVLEDIAIRNKIANTASLQGREDAYERARIMLRDNAEEHVEYIKNALNEFEGSELHRYEKAAMFYQMDITATAERMSKFKQAAAGQINLPLFKIRRIRDIAHDSLNADEHALLEHILEASEEAFLSPKHNEVRIVSNPFVLEELDRGIQAAIGAPRRGDRAGTQLLEEWFSKNLPGRYKEDVTGVELERATREAPRLISKLFRSTENIDKYNMFLSVVGARQKGIDPSRIESSLIFPAEDQGQMARTYRALQAIAPEAKFIEDTAVQLKTFEEGPSRFLESNYRPPSDPAVRESAQSIWKQTAATLSRMNITGKDLAFGALGLAGAAMVAGFVGGNPAAPVTGHANQVANDESLYVIPNFTDQGVAMGGQGQQGYIININAQSEKGREYTQQAIQQAMASSYATTNVNISMNIRDSTGNITDRNIERMIEGAFNI